MLLLKWSHITGSFSLVVLKHRLHCSSFSFKIETFLRLLEKVVLPVKGEFLSERFHLVLYELCA